MDEEMNYYNPIDCDKLSDYKLESVLFEAARIGFEEALPNEKIPDSVCIGRIYKNKKTISAKVAYPQNDVFCQVTYYCDLCKFSVKVYELKNTSNILYGTVKGDCDPCFMLVGDRSKS